MRLGACGFLCILGLVVMPCKLWAAVVLDQSVSGQVNAGTNVSNTQFVSQTFTIGVTGVLAQIDLQMRRDGFNLPTSDLIVDFFETANSNPAIPEFGHIEPIFPSLGSVSVSPTRFPLFSPPTTLPTDEFISIDVSSLNISVSSGDVLAIEASYPNGSGRYVWLNTFGIDEYLGGSAFIRDPPSSEFLGPFSFDLGFQTYVDAVVPEPSSFAALALGGMLITGRRRRRVAR